VQGDRTTIDGLEAFVGVYQGQIQGLGNVTMRAAHIAYERNVFMVAGLAAPNIFQQADGAILTSVRSFKRLTPAEAENIRPNRIDLYVVRGGDTWQSIADRSGGVIKPATLAVMNKAQPNSQPQPGARIKIVVGG
jgi:predicted Zn-dependent protease